MLIHPTNPSLRLFEPDDVDHDALGDGRHAEAARVLLRWVRDFLCRPHPDLGRPGAVCPFTLPALRRRTLWLSLCPGSELDQDAVIEIIGQYRDWFETLEPTEPEEAQYKTILILFPDVSAEDAPTVIDAVQNAQKGEFVSNELMLGQFHPGCPEPGLRNPRFRPLQAPVPLLAIRHMVRTDLPFLVGDADQFHSYLRRFGEDVPAKLQSDLAAACQRHGVPS